MTSREASKLIKQTCIEQKIPFAKVSAQTVSFSDLARGDRVFVTVFGWIQNDDSASRYALLHNIARINGFSVDVRISQT